MCGRFTLRASGREIAEAFELDEVPDWQPRFNLAPTQSILVIRGDSASLLRWGLIASWADRGTTAAPLVNARADTIASKPTFRSAIRQRRCLVPADGFYEWQQLGRKKQPYLFTIASSRLFAIAGLWEVWEHAGERIESVCLITTEANAVVQPIHDRMPVILPAERWAQWLSPSTDLDAVLDMLRPYPAEQFRSQAVSSYVNHACHEGPACVEPVLVSGTLF